MSAAEFAAFTDAELDEGLRVALINNVSQDIGRIMAELNRRSVQKFLRRNPTWPRDYELTEEERREPPEVIDPQTGFVE